MDEGLNVAEWLFRDSGRGLRLGTQIAGDDATGS